MIRSFIISAALLGSITARSQESLQIRELTLRNGMTVWLNRDTMQNKVIGTIVVRAGAVDTPDTGIAHYLEHMAFKGTDCIGTIDYAAEKPILDSIATQYRKLSATSDPVERKAIQSTINGMNLRAAHYAIPNEFNNLITRYGGSGLNAGTGYDQTVYYNDFAPQYLRQWCMLASQRLINPVFRLFQSELETVYEEKNMYTDFMGYQALEALLNRYFAPSEYGFPVIGSSEHLKNPDMQAMRDFYDKFYVARNMGLILCGNFDPQGIEPLLEETFGRIDAGTASERRLTPPRPFEGRETFEVKVPIPIVRGMMLGWRVDGTASDADKTALELIVQLLNNENGTGSLDLLTHDGKVLAAQALYMDMGAASALGVMAIPPILGQSLRSTEARILERIERIKSGDFPDSLLSDVKLAYKRQQERMIEEPDSRSGQMSSLFAQGKSWQEYIARTASIDTISKAFIRDAALRYFTSDYLVARKRTGRYPKQHIDKPGYSPVPNVNKGAQSEFARRLANVPVAQAEARFADFETDTHRTPLGPQATLLANANPVNGIFTLTLRYYVGDRDIPALAQLASYLGYLGTDSLTYNQMRTSLQHLGSTLDLEAAPRWFDIRIEGYDRNLAPTLQLASHFLSRVKGDKSKLRKVVSEYNIGFRAEGKSPDDVADALCMQVLFSDRSPYIDRLSIKEIRRLTSDELLGLLRRVLSTECDLFYCGNHPSEEVAGMLRGNFDFDTPRTAGDGITFLPARTYDQPILFFIDDPRATQSVIQSYIALDPASTPKDNEQAQLFNYYFGRGMGSLMFQQIRELRSLAYGAGSGITTAPPALSGAPGRFITSLSTQSDKTVEALLLLDSLLRQMPADSTKISLIRAQAVNDTNASYPPMRQMGRYIATLQRRGYTEDPQRTLAEAADTATIGTICDFYDEQVRNRPIIYMVVGNRKKIDMKALEGLGRLEEVDKKSLYRK